MTTFITNALLSKKQMERGNGYAKNQKSEMDHSYCNRFDFGCGHKYGAPAQLINYIPERLSGLFLKFFQLWRGNLISHA